MKITLVQEALNSGLQCVNRVITTKGQLPILANVLIESTKTGVVLSATNLEMGLRVDIGGKVDQEGSLTIPAKSLAEFVGSLPSGNISMQAENDKLKIAGGKSTANFAGIAATEFPVLPALSQTTTQLSGMLIKQIATQVAYAAATDESRPVLTGIKLTVVSGQLTVVGTDGFRMSKKIISNFKLKISNSLILPAKTIQELARLVGDDKKAEIAMELGVQNNQVIFGVSKVQLISRILEGNFPDVDKIIPESWRTQVTIDRSELLKVVRAASIFARENNNVVKLTAGDGQLTISAKASSLGENSSQMEVETTGPEIELAFNYKYVLDFLNSVDSDEIVIQAGEGLAPVQFSPQGDGSLIHIIMPVRV